MTTPFTREEINTMDDNLFLDLIKNSPSRFYPYCLVGENIHEARIKFKTWTKGKVEILISDKDTCAMDYNTSYFYCHTNEDDIITEIWKAFD